MSAGASRNLRASKLSESIEQLESTAHLSIPINLSRREGGVAERSQDTYSRDVTVIRRLNLHSCAKRVGPGMHPEGVLARRQILCCGAVTVSCHNRIRSAIPDKITACQRRHINSLMGEANKASTSRTSFVGSEQVNIIFI